MKELVKRIAKAILWPLSRFFDPRFEGINQALHVNTLASIEATTLLGRSIADLQAQTEASIADLRRLLEETHKEASKASRSYFEHLLQGSTSDIDVDVASVLEREAGHRGFAAQRGLWFNPPVRVGYAPGDVVLRGVSERIAEIPYVFSAVGRLKAGASILDVGAAESHDRPVSRLTRLRGDRRIDVRPYPFSHPRLRSVVGAVEEWETNERFDAVVCLSTIEHIGLGAYGEEASDGRADLAAMRRILELTKPGGMLVLTTRFGEPDVDELQRTYDRDGLDALLEWLERGRPDRAPPRGRDDLGACGRRRRGTSGPRGGCARHGEASEGNRPPVVAVSFSSTSRASRARRTASAASRAT